MENSSAVDPVTSKADRNTRLRELVALFLKLGVVGFGGPAAHIAMMEDEVVRRRQWLTRERFLDLLGATNLIPGPNSTEMALHIGQQRAGFPGLIVAGACFILPAMILVMFCAWAYVRFGKVPEVQDLLYAVKPVIIAIVLQALWGLARTAVKTRVLAVIGCAVVVLSFLRVNELLLLFIAGVLIALVCAMTKGQSATVLALAPPVVVPSTDASATIGATAMSGAAVASTFGLGPLFLFFLKVGSVLYGSGYVLLAFLRSDLVERWHWLTEAQLLDAIAVGQITPGPVFTTATFIGYLLGGVPGALIATLGIFLPAFFFVAISGPLIPLIRRSAVAGAFLDGVNVASLALMAVVTWQLGRTALVDATTIGLAVISAVLLLRFKLNSVWLVAGGGAVGLLARWAFGAN